jgi:hypothetical protein
VLIRRPAKLVATGVVIRWQRPVVGSLSYILVASAPK